MYHYWYSSAYIIICILVKGLIILIAIPEQVGLHMSRVEHQASAYLQFLKHDAFTCWSISTPPGWILVYHRVTTLMHLCA